MKIEKDIRSRGIKLEFSRLETSREVSTGFYLGGWNYPIFKINTKFFGDSPKTKLSLILDNQAFKQS